MGREGPHRMSFHWANAVATSVLILSVTTCVALRDHYAHELQMQTTPTPQEIANALNQAADLEMQQP